MKKRYISLLMLTGVFIANTKAQYTTLLSQDFQANPITDIVVGAPDPGDPSVWYSYDDDPNSDASGGARPEEWFLGYAFALTDSLLQDGSDNIVLSSNSWLNGTMVASHWFVSPTINVTNASYRLRFKSAPRQTPRYLDGFRVCVSTTVNDDFANFNNNVLFTASEMTGNPAPPNPNNFNSYTYNPTIAGGGWIHGWDGSTIQVADLEYNGDSTRWIGVLTEHTINLGAFAGQQIYIAFHHNSEDDNLISIDDIVVEYIMGTEENKLELFTSVYPNPTTDMLDISFNLQEGIKNLYMEITDVLGRQVLNQSFGETPAGKHIKRLDVSKLPVGTYNITIRTDKGFNNISFIKQ
jgi:hypothetical protein